MNRRSFVRSILSRRRHRLPRRCRQIPPYPARPGLIPIIPQKNQPAGQHGQQRQQQNPGVFAKDGRRCHNRRKTGSHRGTTFTAHENLHPNLPIFIKLFSTSEKRYSKRPIRLPRIDSIRSTKLQSSAALLLTRISRPAVWVCCRLPVFRALAFHRPRQPTRLKAASPPQR